MNARPSRAMSTAAEEVRMRAPFERPVGGERANLLVKME